ncbi:MAG: ABC transporter permease subunit, partial [Verrucomicrobiota bacterium]
RPGVTNTGSAPIAHQVKPKVNNRAVAVWYDGKLSFPTHGAFHPGTTYGFDYAYETNYRDLKKRFQDEKEGNWVLLPLIPYNALEQDFEEGKYGPQPPSWERRHILGTDNTGRDIFARLFYGYRLAMTFASLFLIAVYIIGIIVGCSMGYFGGRFDLIVQRIIEIWANIPFLYIIIIVASIVRPNLLILLGIYVFFQWTSMTYYMRTESYRERARDYISAARVIGAGDGRIIVLHLLPNTISTLVTFMPFTIAGAITSLTALDFLGFGLPPPTPSWGELLKRGVENLNAPWIVSSAFGGLVLVLNLVTFVGEAIREAFDPKKFTQYR